MILKCYKMAAFRVWSIILIFYQIMTKVHVEQGWLEGEVLQVVTGDGEYHSFKGIPYAAPPVGKLRFKAPTPPKSWEGVRKATSHGPSCHQKDIFTDAILGTEDCLYLNVYTPSPKPNKPLPVMVFIHGGGFKSGSGNDDVYGPDFLIKENIVLVTINYRLEVLGFLCLDTPEVPGNAGLKDQAAALKWVQKNIAGFGGDPTCVTVFGESAGSASTGFHMLSPMSKGLFKRAILMSGVPICDWTLPYLSRKRGIKLAQQLGCDKEDPHEVLKFLQKVPTDKLINTEPFISSIESVTNHPCKMYHFTPVVEKNFGQDAFLLEEPLNLLARGEVNEVDAIFGYTNDECVLGLGIWQDKFFSDYELYPDLFVPRRILYEASVKNTLSIAEDIMMHYFGRKRFSKENIKEFVKYSTDETFVYKIHKYMQLVCKAKKGKCYLYNFTAFTERNVYGNQKKGYNITGVSHLDDLFYLFHPKVVNLPIVEDSKSYKLIRQTCALFANFAKYGNPTPDSSLGVIWPQYTEESKRNLNIGEKLIPGEDANKDVIEFWDSIYEKSGVSCAKYV